MTQSVRAHLLNFAVPIGTVGLAFVLTESIPTFRNSAPFFLFLTAVLLSTWYGGWFSGLLATVLAAGATGSYFMQAHQSPFGQDSLIRWSLFVLISLIISSLHASRTRHAGTSAKPAAPLARDRLRSNGRVGLQPHHPRIVVVKNT